MPKLRLSDHRPLLLVPALVLAVACGGPAPAPVVPARPSSAAAPPPAPAGLLTGEAAKGDWTTDAPGVRRKLTLADLPLPFATDSVDNGPKVIPRPEGAWP